MISLAPNALDPAIRRLLDRLRGRIRRYVVLEGLAALAACAGLAFWLSLGFDWWLEPPAAVRVGVLIASFVALAWVAYRYLVRRLSAPLPDRSLALLLERRFPTFEDSLVTTVELSSVDLDRAGYNARMYAHTGDVATGHLPHVELGRVFNRGPLTRKWLAAAVLLSAVVLLAVVSPSVVRFWYERNVLLSSELWPRRVWLSVAGFDGAAINVARGSDYQLVVRADTAAPLVPETVQVRYERDGASGYELMNRVGVAQPGQDEYQEYVYTFKNVLSSIDFDLRGGDARLRGLRIEVAERPGLADMVLAITYPEYTERGVERLPVSGIMRVPVGSHVRLQASANKPLVELRIEEASVGQTQPLDSLSFAASSEPTSIDYDLGVLQADRTLLFDLRDTDGITNREPIRLTLSALPDEPPRVVVQLRAIGEAVTPEAQLPAAGEVTDDHGLSRVWYEIQVDDQLPSQHPILDSSAAEQSRLRLEGELAKAFDLRQLGLKVGQMVSVSIKAADNSRLTSEPNVGTSEQFRLEVVTPSQLLALLEARELMQRRRFEAILGLVAKLRDSLVLPTATSGAGGEELPAAEPPAVVARRALSESSHYAQELAGMSATFRDLHQELLNNRMDIAEKRTRLVDRIAVPLGAVVEDDFTRLDQLLRELERSPGGDRVRRQLAAQRQADVILVRMDEVLQQMLKLEDFNQLVEMLRDVIRSQEQLNEETGRRQKSALRDLLE